MSIEDRRRRRMMLARRRRRNKRIAVAAAILVVAGIVIWILFATGVLGKKDDGPASPITTPTPEITMAPAVPSVPAESPELTAAPEPTATPAAYKLMPEDEGVYTIAWMSDTQHYSKKYPATYEAMTAFLAAEQERMNLKYIVHTGDIVGNADNADQWKAADKAMDSIAAIPYGVTAGNHDMVEGSPSASNLSGYTEHFGDDAMAARGSDSYRAETYKDNLGHVDLITAGGTDYVFVYMGYSPENAAYEWASEMFGKYSDRVGVLCVHDYLTRDITLTDAGKRWQERVVVKNSNVYMVLCGHNYSIGRLDAKFDDDGDGTAERTVYQMLCNYQTAGSEGGSGYMRFMQVDEAAGKIYCFSYSPVAEDYIYFDNPGTQEETYPSDPKEEEFVLDINWPTDG